MVLSLILSGGHLTGRVVQCQIQGGLLMHLGMAKRHQSMEDQ